MFLAQNLALSMHVARREIESIYGSYYYTVRANMCACGIADGISCYFFFFRKSPLPNCFWVPDPECVIVQYTL